MVPPYDETPDSLSGIDPDAVDHERAVRRYLPEVTTARAY
jgi:hypothetical protein